MLPVLLSAIRQSPPAVGLPHDGKKIGQDFVTYTYKQVKKFLLMQSLLVQLYATLAYPDSLVSHRHCRWKCSVPRIRRCQGQAVDNGRVGRTRGR